MTTKLSKVFMPFIFGVGLGYYDFNGEYTKIKNKYEYNINNLKNYNDKILLKRNDLRFENVCYKQFIDSKQLNNEFDTFREDYIKK